MPEYLLGIDTGGTYTNGALLEKNSILISLLQQAQITARSFMIRQSINNQL
jgi:hypothetical protein